MKKRVIGLCVMTSGNYFMNVDHNSGGYVFWSSTLQIFPVNCKFSSYQLKEMEKEKAEIKEVFIEI